MKRALLFLGFSAVFAGPAAQAAATTIPSTEGVLQQSTQDQRPKVEQSKKKAAEVIAKKGEEMAALRSKANEVTSKMAELAKSGSVTSDESVKALQEMVQELQKINEQLKKMQEEIDDIKGWIEGQNESMPVLIGDVENLKRATWGNYVQFQFTDTEEGPNSLGGRPRTNNDGFAMRRFRLSTTNRIDPRTQAKLSFDVSAGSQRQTAELKDAQIQWDIVPSDTQVGIQVLAGQQPIPLGYELERSSSEREMPERASYNRIMFNGERGRGVYAKYGLTKNLFAHAGVWNALSVNDPQQTDQNRFGNLDGTHLAFHGGLRYQATTFDFGISALVGDRAAVASRTTTVWTDSNNNGTIDSGEVRNTIVPAIASNQRRFIYLDGTYVGFLFPELTLRGEMMFGSDRNPTLNSGVPVALGKTNMRGYQLQATFNVNYRNAITARYDEFDPDTGTGSNTVSTFGLGYTYYINPGARLTLAHEWNREQPFNSKNNVWTLRVQYRL
ncbi:MAG TPA: porin [Fimbriimonadaceae bacterium]|nr:porin [Fimbriimonadaceae bacterium]